MLKTVAWFYVPGRAVRLSHGTKTKRYTLRSGNARIGGQVVFETLRKAEAFEQFFLYVQAILDYPDAWIKDGTRLASDEERREVPKQTGYRCPICRGPMVHTEAKGHYCSAPNCNYEDRKKGT